jgi:membrane fusion protein (multidrug efflux system)
MKHALLSDRSMPTRGKPIPPAARILAAAAMLAFLAAIPGCSKKVASQDTSAPAALLVGAGDIAGVEAQRLESGVLFTGDLRPQETTRVIARFDGDIRRVLVREGESVRHGQTLAQYEPRDIRDMDQAAEADLLAAQAQLLAAQNAERRAARLLDAGAASPSDMETATAMRSAAEARVQAAEAVQSHTRENSDRLRVPAPFSGAVSEIFVHEGSRTAIGDPLLTVVDTDTLELTGTVPSEALGRVRVGALMRFRIDAFPGESFEARLDRVNPTTEPGTRQVRVYARVPNPDGRLVGGMFASGRVIEAASDSALAAPVAALRREGSEDVVYRIRGGKAQRLPVRIGLRDEERGLVELVADVAAGDSLLTGVLPGIRDGVTVQVLAAAPNAAPAR